MGYSIVTRNELEFDFQEAVIDEILRSYLTYGCVLLRRFVEPAALLNLRLMLEPFFTEEPGAHVYLSDIRTTGLPDFHQYLFADKHHELLSTIFGSHEYGPNPNTTTSRRVDPSWMDDPKWQSPLAPHMDSFFHSFNFTVNFWIPFNACGDDKPSLAVVPVSFQTARDFAGYDGNPAASGEQHPQFRNFRPEMLALWRGDPDATAKFRATFADRVWAPTYQVGDAMMLSNWTLHFTHSGPEMNTRRENVELRFESNVSLETVLQVHA